MTLSKWAILSVAATLAGCSTLSPEAARKSAEALYSARSGVPAGAGIPQNSAASMEGVLATLTAKPLDSDSSVRVALLHSVRVQSIYAQLGFARADLYDATRLSNPVLGYVRLTGGDAPPKTDWSLSQNFTELLFLRFRRNSAESGMQLAEQRVARELMELEADVRTAYYRYAASNMILMMRERVARTTQVSATYAQQLFEAGNITALQRARLQEAADLAKSDQLRAFSTKTLHRNALLTLLGYASNDAAPQITGQLSIPASISPEASGLKSWALANRLDLLSAREALRFAGVVSTHARRWRLLGDTTVGIAVEREGNTAAQRPTTASGPSASLSLPLFNQGGSSVTRTRATVDTLQANVQALEIGIGNDVETSVLALGAARETVDLFRQKLLPTQRAIVDESQKQQNYMLVGTFELLAARQHQYEGYEGYIDALRDYWIAVVDLGRATGGRLPDTAPVDNSSFVEPLAGTDPTFGDRP